MNDKTETQQQEPVATVQCINGVTIGYLEVMQPIGTKLYTTSPSSSLNSIKSSNTLDAHRKPLTDEEIDLIGKRMFGAWHAVNIDRDFARAIEAAHGIKGEA